MIENMDNINVLISETKIEKRLNELAKQIMKDYGEEDLVFVDNIFHELQDYENIMN